MPKRKKVFGEGMTGSTYITSKKGGTDGKVDIVSRAFPNDTEVEMMELESQYSSDNEDALEERNYREDRKRQKEAEQLKNKKMKKPSLGKFMTKGKQRILEGGGPKTSRMGAGLSMLKNRFRSFGAKKWWKSKTH